MVPGGHESLIMSTALRELYWNLHVGANYRLRTFAGGRWASHCRPTSIVLLLTERCNARCVHCDIWKNRGKEDSPSLEQWQTVLSDLRAWLGPAQVTFTGGEALLKPYTIELVRHAHSLGLKLEVLTHGYWDDQSKIEQLALGRPSRLTVSLDGVGEKHNQVRGRPDFFEKTSRSIETFLRIRRERGLGYTVRLKNVLMSHNLDQAEAVASFGNRDGMEVFYQPVEQNYNTAEDPKWFEHSENWPRDPSVAVAVIGRLIALKRQGYRIANSYSQLEAMVPYFRNPGSMRVAVQSHSAHERRALCAALTMLQFQANGDVTVCYGMPPVGNIRNAPIRQIWERRPRFWESGCCLERRCTVEEKTVLSLPVVP
jgi:MoaA/NifB/PqqE/SkfB family radical SAM enzyme